MGRILVLALGLLGSSGAWLAAQSPLQVKWSDERLSVTAAEASLAEVMAEVAKQTGVRVAGRDRLRGRITVAFADAPLEDAIARLLKGVNYIAVRPSGADRGGPSLAIHIHAMANAPVADSAVSGPIYVPALEVLVAAEAADEESDRELDEEDDPKAADRERRAEMLAAAQLASEGAFGPDVEVASLAQHLGNLYNDWIRLEAVNALDRRPLRTTLPLLLRALGDDRHEVRTAAVEILGRATDPHSLRAVGQLIEGQAARPLRISALRVIALRAGEEPFRTVRHMLADPDPDLRDAAEQLLAEMERRAEARTAHRQ